MANPFTETFDNHWPHPIEWVPNQVAGKFDANGVFTAGAAPTPVVIRGHLTSYGSFERSRMESDWGSVAGRDRKDGMGPTETGDRLFVSETHVPKGDLIEFWLDSAGAKKVVYRVIADAMTKNLMAKVLGVPVRYEHRLLECPQ